MRPAQARADSIAVLPFANLSGDPAQAYFSDGIAEELRSALSRLAGLKVVARTSSEAVRNDDAQRGAEARRRQHPDRQRPPIRVDDPRQRSARRRRRGSSAGLQSYDRAPGDAIQIQTDIADSVADALSIRLGGADRKRLAKAAQTIPTRTTCCCRPRPTLSKTRGRRLCSGRSGWSMPRSRSTRNMAMP